MRPGIAAITLLLLAQAAIAQEQTWRKPAASERAAVSTVPTRPVATSSADVP